jgi:hypothetical protein
MFGRADEPTCARRRGAGTRPRRLSPTASGRTDAVSVAAPGWGHGRRRGPPTARAPGTIGGGRTSGAKRGAPGCQAPGGGGAGANARGERTARRPGAVLAAPSQAAAARATGAGGVGRPDACPRGALSTGGVSHEFRPAEGRPGAREARPGAPPSEARGTPSGPASAHAAPRRDEHGGAAPGRASQPCLERRVCPRRDHRGAPAAMPDGAG